MLVAVASKRDGDEEFTAGKGVMNINRKKCATWAGRPRPTLLPLVEEGGWGPPSHVRITSMSHTRDTCPHADPV